MDWRALRDGSWVTERRVRGYGGVLLAVEVVVALFMAAGTHGLIVPLAHPVSTDFVSFYAAGILADGGTPALVYDQAAHLAAEQQATAAGIPYTHFYYPPIFLLLCAPLARLPYLLAFALFQIVPLIACLALVRRILPGTPWHLVAAFPPVFWAVGTGQNALLTAALLAGGTLALERGRAVLAGLLFGVLCYKPHFGLLVPLALLAGGYCRTLVAAAASVAALAAVSVLAFGWDTWSAFLISAAGAGRVYAAPGAIDFAGVTSPFGLALALGGPAAVAAGVQAVAILAGAAAVGAIWKTSRCYTVRAAVLLTAMPIAVPILLFYDLALVGIALAWLVRAGREHGFPPWQQTGLVALFVSPLWSGNIGACQHLVPPLAAALAFALALRQAGQERRALRPGVPGGAGGRLHAALAAGAAQG
jgi:alpha-1,2-mannosyltransferase